MLLISIDNCNHRVNVDYVNADGTTKEELIKTAFEFLKSFMEYKAIDNGYSLLIKEILELTFSLLNALGCVYPDIMWKQVSKDENIIYNMLKSSNI